MVRPEMALAGILLIPSPILGVAGARISIPRYTVDTAEQGEGRVG